MWNFQQSNEGHFNMLGTLFAKKYLLFFLCLQDKKALNSALELQAYMI